jgi:hypothetical protein
MFIMGACNLTVLVTFSKAAYLGAEWKQKEKLLVSLK